MVVNKTGNEVKAKVLSYEIYPSGNAAEFRVILLQDGRIIAPAKPIVLYSNGRISPPSYQKYRDQIYKSQSLRLLGKFKKHF
ncbi:hypothetical protein ABEY96_28275 [Priestia aryabhattai]|uniref:hypothetical protein n=1 Tax=Priestia aryabhattai TaxID=412384 RepID=UPI003D28E26E